MNKKERKLIYKTAPWTCLSLAAAMGVGLLVLPVLSQAVTGQCANCHTMHNSQGGAAVATVYDYSTDTTSIGGPNPVLLLGTCVACHTGDNDGLSSHAPYVNSSTDPGYDNDYSDGNGQTSLAGGNFYWVRNGAGTPDRKGHNVEDVAAQDTLTTPPGSTLDFSANQLKCAGVYGCHGVRTAGNEDPMTAISGSHHGNVNGALYTAGDVASSYRFLNGIYGFEDPDYEYTATDGTTDHNQYYGVDRTAETDVNAHTISYLCAECHYDFHNGAGNVSTTFTSPWLRHPTDFDLANVSAKEYGDYGGAGVNDYIVQAPVASATTTYAAQADIEDTNVLAGPDTAIVTCISCHRAHGSPNDYILRWFYDDITVGATAGNGGGQGCFHCHTEKDGV